MPSSRIALLFEFPTMNGGERSMLAVLEHLRAAHADFDFVAIGPAEGRLGEALRARQIPVIDWSIRDDRGVRRSDAQIEESLVTILRELRPQLVHANSLSMGRWSGRVGCVIGIPASSHLRDIIRLSAQAVASLNLNQRLVAVSQATRDFHVDQGLDSSRTIVVKNGVDLNRFQPRTPFETARLHESPERDAISTDEEAATECKLPAGVPTFRTSQRTWIATIGQIGLRKGHDLLAQAAPRIVARIANAEFLMIGERTSQKTESVAYERAIHEQFTRAGLAERLHFLAYRDDIPTLLQEADLLAHPARQEPYGRVLLEAAASGVPVVAFDVGGNTEIIIDHVTGRVVPAGDVPAFADAVIEILSDARLTEQMRIAARARAVAEFPIATAASRLLQVWQEMLGGH